MQALWRVARIPDLQKSYGVTSCSHEAQHIIHTSVSIAKIECQEANLKEMTYVQPKPSALSGLP